MEYGPVDVLLSDLIVDGQLDLYPEVTGRDYFKFYIKRDRLVFQASGFVGFIPINDRVALDVRPRVPIDSLERLLQITGESPISLRPHLRRYTPHKDFAPSLLDTFAESIFDFALRIEAHGLHRSYVQRSADTSFPRGRIQIGKTMQRHEARGIHHRAAVTWFEPSTDTAANRCIKYAIWYLAQCYRSMDRVKGVKGMLSKLNRAYSVFNGVSLDESKAFLADPLVVTPTNLPAIRAYYEDAIHLAVTIINNEGIALSKKGSEVLLPSLLINLENVFEKYVREVLSSKVEQIQPSLQVLDGNVGGPRGGKKPLFDNKKDHPAKPDVVFKLEEGESIFYPLLIDAKYKKSAEPAREEIEQIISYGASYRSPNLVIVHPRIEGTGHGLYPIGRLRPMTLYHYLFDLAADDPEAEELKFAECMVRLARHRRGKGNRTDGR
jgi:5-methylcytosine-specific restriction enzyme subunit McrC